MKSNLLRRTETLDSALEVVEALEEKVDFLNKRWEKAEADEIVSEAVRFYFPGQIATVSSFGADSAVLLHLLATVDRKAPILFLDTGKHFLETLTYRDILVDRFGFHDVRSLVPEESRLSKEDPKGDLWRSNPDRCCTVRKVIPLDQALSRFSAWITGRKRYQSTDRAALKHAEIASGRIKINPLAAWSEEQVRKAFKDYGLPAHPLFDEGFASIGCAPCTRRLIEGEDLRAGRWAGSDKTECGIHL